MHKALALILGVPALVGSDTEDAADDVGRAAALDLHVHHGVEPSVGTFTVLHDIAVTK